MTQHIVQCWMLGDMQLTLVKAQLKLFYEKIPALVNLFLFFSL